MGYHKLDIHKHQQGSPYKIQEEFLEYIDALATGNKIMAVQELSDLFGCIKLEASKLGYDLNDLRVMSDLTKKVFEEGTRKNDNLLDYLRANCKSIENYGLGFIQVKFEDINYNFYHKDLPEFSNYDSPHNHQRDFVSEVIKGEVREILFKVSDGDDVAYCGCGEESGDTLKYSYEVDSTKVYRQGDLYLRKKEDFHSVDVEHGTVTKVVKYGESDTAWVLSDKVDSKIQKIDEEVLWAMVKEVYNV